MAKANQQSKYTKEVHLVRSPTLLIGIGGIGGQIVKGVYDTMSDYDRTYVEMVVMDTNINDLDKFIGTGIRFVQTSENRVVQSYLEANAEYAEWFPVNPLINAKNLSQGAGQIRSVSRLGALASKAEGRFNVIDEAVDRILTNHGDKLVRAVRVMIVGSATGGTGSGLGVQLPFYVRRVLEDKNVPNVLVRGMFLMPSLTEDVQDTEAKEKSVNVNGYAFLKEISAFYHMQNVDAENNPLVVEEYVPGKKAATNGGKSFAAAGSVPYDFLFLVEKFGKRGAIGDLGDYIARSSQIVMNQLFSPIAAHGFSVEDNLITSSVPTGGMNRYCGAGIANAIYPKDEVMRYCTVRYAGDLISDYWLQIDDEFRRRDEQQRRLKKSNSKLASLDRGATYCQIFDDMCDPYKHNVTSEISELKAELFVKEIMQQGDQKIEKDVPLTKCMPENIEKHLDKIFKDTGLASQADNCKMDREQLNAPDEALGEVALKMSKLSQFQVDADKKISDLVQSTADEILPADLKQAQSCSLDARHNVYIALSKKHPIAARYLLYALRADLSKLKSTADAELQKYSRVKETIFNKDYFREGANDTQNETPSDALSKTPAGFLSPVGLNSAAYNRLTRTISKDAADEATRILNMAKATLRSTVCRIVLERLDVLIGLYEDFFEELRNIVTAKAEEKQRLECGLGSGTDKDYKGDLYICANAQCKQFLYDEFQENVSSEELEMSPEVKQGLFEKMFDEYAARLTEANKSTAHVSHISLSDLFEEGVLEPITSQFSGKGFGHLDMSILQAIKKQYEIEHDCQVTDVANDVNYQQYFKDVCDSLRVLAQPYLSYEAEVSGYPSGGRLTYSWGLNHSAVSVYQSGAVKPEINTQNLQDMFKDKEAALADESFDPCQMVCYGAIYDLQVENCTKYRVGEKAEKCYAERLKNLLDQAYVISTEADGYLNVIHPHLDCHWHEHAYLPELMGYDEEKLCKQTNISFMMALCLGLCYHETDPLDDLTCWWYRRVSDKLQKPVFVDGKELRSKSIYRLYKAFDSNRIIVADVQECIRRVKEKAAQEDRPIDGMTVEVVLAQPLVQALLGNGKGKEKYNVLDLLYLLLKDSGSNKILEDNIKNLEQYLDEYCLELANKNANRAAKFGKAIRLAIGSASKALNSADVSGVFKACCENFLPEE